MMKIDNIEELQLEMTSNCNAACPQCSRSDPKAFYHLAETNYNDITTWFNIDFTKQLRKILYNGSYGDAVMVNDFPKIAEYFISHNVFNSLNTNGSLRTVSWWTDLGKLFSSKLGNNVTFSIDGLEDTNHIYRINTNWNKIIENAQAYISTGAYATWNFIAFKHNEHQVEKAMELAKKLGFKEFRIKGSHRAATPDGLKSEKFPFPIKEQENKITCDSLNHNYLYIDFNGDVWPCPMVGVKKYLDRPSAMEIRDSLDLYPENFNNLRHHRLEEIVDHEFFTGIKESWSTEKELNTCSKHCSTPTSRCGLQFLQSIEL